MNMKKMDCVSVDSFEGQGKTAIECGGRCRRKDSHHSGRLLFNIPSKNLKKKQLESILCFV